MSRRTSLSHHGFRIGLQLLSTAALLTVGSSLDGGLLAQKPAGQAADPTKPGKKPRVEEEDGPSKVPVRVEEGDPFRPAVSFSLPTDLLREAENAKNETARALYRRLALPHDELSGQTADHWIEPLARHVGPRPNGDEGFTARRMDEKGRLLDAKKFPRTQGVVHYEALAVSQVSDFLEPPDKKGVPPRLEALQHAEKALSEVVRFHETARERRQRAGAGWEDLEERLRARLLTVRVEQLRCLAKDRKWPLAGELAALLVKTYPRQPEVRAAVIEAAVQQARAAVDGGRPDGYVQARQVLEQLERFFHDSEKEKDVRTLRGQLEDKARGLLREVEKLAGKDRAAATQQLLLAESVWPQLPQLAKLRRDFQIDTVLYVGVRQLPTFLSPATASTDAERQAIDLLFESLVRPLADPAVGQGYEMVLAAGSPRLLALGRQFQLVRDARWYRERGGNEPTIDEPVTATDIRALFQLQQEPLRSPQWKELLAGVREGGDPFSLRLTLQQGYLDPLSLLTFKVLPAKYLKDLDDPAFARQPIGSGPYQYQGRDRDPRTGVEYAVFRANPTYGRRTGKTGRPLIREVRFYSTQGRTALTDFQHENRDPPHLHVLLDLPTENLKELYSPQASQRKIKVYERLPNRRVYFLAVNHRDPALGNVDLRRALALAIDREKVLDGCFRYPEHRGPKLHRGLNGPYPAGSWACDPTLPAQLHDRVMAQGLASKAKLNGVRLELKFPNDAPEIAGACQTIRNQVREQTGIDLQLSPCAPAELHDAVQRKQNYQLAYVHWDYTDESYWLWPLFDPNSAGRGGTNILGPTNDAVLFSLFHKAMQHREFAEVQRLTHMIHRHLHERMPLIPLWQLDIHLAMHDSVKTLFDPGRLDPLTPFTHIEAWRLER